MLAHLQLVAERTIDVERAAAPRGLVSGAAPFQLVLFHRAVHGELVAELAGEVTMPDARAEAMPEGQHIQASCSTR